MGVNKFFVFKEDGTLARLKSSISRFLDNDPPDNDDKVNIRASISVPASAEGLTPANNLSDVGNIATARTNLSINSKEEDAQAYALKTTAPALCFNGTSSFLTVANDDKLSFTDGVDDLPFSFSAWVKMIDATSFIIASKYSGSNATSEWVIDVNSSDKLRLFVQDTSGNQTTLISDAVLTSYEGEWVHLAFTYGGAGPSAASGAAFTANMSGGNAVLYVNGSAVSSATATDNPSYGGMSNTSQLVYLGRLSSTYAEGSMREVKIFNRSLTASEIAELARGNDLGFSEEWAGANGGVYSSDFTSDSTDSWSPTRATLDATATVGGDSDNLKVVSDATAANDHSASRSASAVATGCRFRLSGEYYIPSGQTAVDGFAIYHGAGDPAVIVTSGTTDAWTRFEFESVAVGTNQFLYIYLRDGSSLVFNGVSGEYVAFRNIKVTQLGTLADFRAEDYNESASKLLDRSSNNFVGVGTSVTLTGKQRHLSADTIDLKNLPTSSAGLSAGEVWNNSGVLTVV